MSSAVTIRGTRDGLLVVLGSAETDALVAELDNLLSTREAFFRGGEVVLQFGEHGLNSRDVARVLEVMNEHMVSVRAVLGKDVGSLSSAIPRDEEPAGGPAGEPAGEQAEERGEQPSVDAVVQGTDSDMGILVRRTLRSGQSVYYPGHVVVIGDVNPGAEIVAEGDIVIWGHLRGIVHAGAAGDEERCICALTFSPTQLRIAGRIARPPEQRRGKKFGPERAFIGGDQIMVKECF